MAKRPVEMRTFYAAGTGEVPKENTIRILRSRNSVLCEAKDWKPQEFFCSVTFAEEERNVYLSTSSGHAVISPHVFRAMLNKMIADETEKRKTRKGGYAAGCGG